VQVTAQQTRQIAALLAVEVLKPVVLVALLASCSCLHTW